ncbi:MAG: hypothetical protein V2A73_00750 [Pseudomonadota bacterium]
MATGEVTMKGVEWLDDHFGNSEEEELAEEEVEQDDEEQQGDSGQEQQQEKDGLGGGEEIVDEEQHAAQVESQPVEPASDVKDGSKDDDDESFDLGEWLGDRFTKGMDWLVDKGAEIALGHVMDPEGPFAERHSGSPRYSSGSATEDDSAAETLESDASSIDVPTEEETSLDAEDSLAEDAALPDFAEESQPDDNLAEDAGDGGPTDDAIGDPSDEAWPGVSWEQDDADEEEDEGEEEREDEAED